MSGELRAGTDGRQTNNFPEIDDCRMYAAEHACVCEHIDSVTSGLDPAQMPQ